MNPFPFLFNTGILMRYSMTIETPVGRIGIEENDGAVSRVGFGVHHLFAEEKETSLLKETSRQLREYFEGKRKFFSLPLAPEGTVFMRSVWDALCLVPYGKTATYGEIAERIGNPKAVRAVGMANHRNPIAIIIPCHRIIGSGGKLVGYAGGLDLKRRLLDLENGCPILL